MHGSLKDAKPTESTHKSLAETNIRSIKDARSSTYSTDIAKMIEAPIFHVNGDDPLAVKFVSDMAFDFRQRFGRDAVIDMYCYRRYGHNEGDEPSFTQPDLYAKIEKRPSAVAFEDTIWRARAGAPADAAVTEQTVVGQIDAYFRNQPEDQFPTVRMMALATMPRRVSCAAVVSGPGFAVRATSIMSA